MTPERKGPKTFAAALNALYAHDAARGIAEEAIAVGQWLGATSAPVDVIAAQERVAEALAVLERRLAQTDADLGVMIADAEAVTIATGLALARSLEIGLKNLREALRAEPAKEQAHE